MEREQIVLLQFKSISDGVDYMLNQISPFSFCVGRVYYNNLGEQINYPEELEKPDYINLAKESGNGYIHIDIHNEPVEMMLPGDLYVSDGFIKYYKIVSDK